MPRVDPAAPAAQPLPLWVLALTLAVLACLQACGDSGLGPPSGPVGPEPALCGNDHCEETEDIWNCPEDCPPGLCGNGICEQEETWEDCPEDFVETCGDGVCDPDEDPWICPPDCPQKPASYCGDGACDPGESCRWYLADCATCGNGWCEPACGESVWSCPNDCVPGSSCGNGRCDGGLECATCPADCQGNYYDSCVICCFFGARMCAGGADCGHSEYCGDGICQGTAPGGIPAEDLTTCPDDCCGRDSICGDGECLDQCGESVLTCPADCH